VPSPGASVSPFEDSPATLAESARGWWIAPGAWVEAEWHAVPRLRVLAGLRADGETRFGRSKVWVDPRVSTFLEARPGTTLTAAAGLFGSTPDPLTTSETFGNPDLDPERALHLSTGVRQQLGAGMQVDLTTYYKRLWSLVVPTRAVGSDGRLLRYSNAGLGETVGLELLARRELGSGWFGWIAWTFSRSLRRDDPTDPSYPAWHPFLLDQTHVVATVLSYRLRRDWTLGTRVRAVTGNPVTPAAGAVFDADTGRYQCLPGAPLSQRLPVFFQADARVDKRWRLDTWIVSAYLDVQNVSNRQNAEFRFRSYDCASEVPLPSIPIFPSLGVRAEW
jgi:outer membrane receptor protein involved in Fe transport